jgi:hypothetical protein
VISTSTRSGRTINRPAQLIEDETGVVEADLQDEQEPRTMRSSSQRQKSITTALLER